MRPYTTASFPRYAQESGGAAQTPIAAEVPPQQEVAMGAIPPLVQQGARIGWNVFKATPTNEPEIEHDINKLEEKWKAGTITPEEENRLQYQYHRQKEFEESQHPPYRRKPLDLPLIDDRRRPPKLRRDDDRK